MTDLLSARAQMGMSLGFHILFAVTGVSLPLLMCVAEWRWIRTKDPVYLVLAKRWAKGTAILFGVGAVSGTVLSFELGLLWPPFMEQAGSVIGMPFSLEGFAFFTEAIFLGIYLYGWHRVPERAHLAAGVIVSISGLTSAVFVTFVNAWMNTPAGFTIRDGHFVQIDPVRAMFSPAAIPEAVHMLLAAYCATGFATAAIHSWLYLRGSRCRFNEVAIGIALSLGGAAVLAQSLSGDALARMVARTQPVKLASLEGQFQSEAGAPLRIGGIPSMSRRETRFALEIPHGLSLLAFHDRNAVVVGLDQVPRTDWPVVPLVHIAFQVMVGCGTILSMVAFVGGWLWWRHKSLFCNQVFPKLLVACGPLGFLALESGWMVTELGRQPWIIDHVLRTKDAVTSMPHLEIPFLILTVVYLLLGGIVIWLLGTLVIAPPLEQETPFREGGVQS